MAIVIVILLIVGALSFVWYRNLPTEKEVTPIKPAEQASKKAPKKQPHEDTSKKPHAKVSIPNVSKAKIAGTNKKDHALYSKEIGGHSTPITCLAINLADSLIATSSTDGIIKCLPVHDIGAAVSHDVYISASSPASALALSQNGKRVVAAINGNIRFYSVSIHANTKKIEFVKEFITGWSSIHSVQLIDVEQWMVIIAAGVTTDNKPIVQAYNQKETILNTFVQHSAVKTKHGKVKVVERKAVAVASPDDRLIAICGVTENNALQEDEIGIYEIKRRSDGSAIGLSQVMALAGHVSPVTSVAWNATGKRLVSVCADGTWRFWDVSIRYDEKPRLFSGDLKLENGLVPSNVAIMQGDIVAFTCGRDLYYCNAGDGSVVECIKDAVGNSVSMIRAFQGGMYLATVVDGAKRIPVWKTV